MLDPVHPQCPHVLKRPGGTGSQHNVCIAQQLWPVPLTVGMRWRCEGGGQDEGCMAASSGTALLVPAPSPLADVDGPSPSSAPARAPGSPVQLPAKALVRMCPPSCGAAASSSAQVQSHLTVREGATWMHDGLPPQPRCCCQVQELQG